MGLSQPTRERLTRVFHGADREQAEEMMVESLVGDLSGSDRVAIAVLKLSAGRIDRLRDALLLARTDWRDVLMNAGFGENVEAHLHWQPEDKSPR